MQLLELSKFLAENGFANTIDGQADVDIRAANTLEDAREGDISFLANPRYTNLLGETRASAVIVKNGEPTPKELTVVRCDDPYGAITAAIIRVHGHRNHPQWGQDARAVIADSAEIGENANIGPNVTIAARVTVGRNAVIYPGCYIGDDVKIGDDVTLFPNVVIYNNCVLGHRVTIHSGSVIGHDGLGYAPVGGAWVKIPQAGRAVLEDDVEIGAGCAIDRATLGETRIGQGTKFSDAVVIGHGTKIGPHCMFVAQVGIAGSTKVGHHVTMAGQVGICGHLTIGDNVRIGAKSGVHSNIENDAVYLGSPAIDSGEFKRQAYLVRRLPKLKQRLRDLEKEVARLKENLDDTAAD